MSGAVVVLPGVQAAHDVADEALAALAERPRLAALLRQAPDRGDFAVPS